MGLKFCSICKKSSSQLNHWELNSEEGSICKECLRDIQHFIDENYAPMPLDLIWNGLESECISDVETAIGYLDQLPKTKETLDRLDKIKVINYYLMSEISYFCDELEEELMR